MIKDFIIALCIVICMFVGFFGSLELTLSNPEDYGAYIWFWKKLRREFKIVGCIIIYILVLPAIIVMIFNDIFWKLIEIIFTIFERLFRK